MEKLFDFFCHKFEFNDKIQQIYYKFCENLGGYANLDFLLIRYYCFRVGYIKKLNE